MSAAVDLKIVHDVLVEVAHEAGDMILAATPAHADTKKNSADIVTETDRAVEEMVSTRLRERFPDFDFIGEESYQSTHSTGLTDRPTFIIDPIDGTTNFLHGLPYVAISLGLALSRRPVVGVVYNPFLRHLYTAIKGQGAYLTTPFHPSPTRLPLRQPPAALKTLSHCLVAVEWGSDRSGPDFDVKSSTFRHLAAEYGAMVQGVRSLGSAALNLCAVAAGEMDVYWEAGCWAWDVCAGWVVLEEAGGKVVGCHPGDWSPALEQRRYMGIRAGEGWEGVVEEFWGCVKGKMEVGFDGAE
ncbi:MAG: hypothetical protein FE78DRAFT_73606 [Acidomyces sp. 'richmondensis']|nr:MAG: hypothetical protein FE78DRAFT_73606 [Acidomyces sp. 'richmondensis']